MNSRVKRIVTISQKMQENASIFDSTIYTMSKTILFSK